MLFKNLAQAAAAFLLSTQVSESQAAVTRRATVCNGHAEVGLGDVSTNIVLMTVGKLCSRSYGNVTFVGAHNSYSIGTDRALPSLLSLSFVV